MRTSRAQIVWTWRITTPTGPVYIPDAGMAEAVRKAGAYGPESVQPATLEERQAVAAVPGVGNLVTVTL